MGGIVLVSLLSSAARAAVTQLIMRALYITRGQVHCMAGVSRSASIAVFAAMHFDKVGISHSWFELRLNR